MAQPKQAFTELLETLTQYTSLTVLKFLTSTPNLLFQADLHTSGSNTGVKPGVQLKET